MTPVATCIDHSGLLVDCVLVFAGVPFDVSGSRVDADHDQDFQEVVRILAEATIRIPVSDLLREPRRRDRIVVAGESFRVETCRHIGSSYLVTVTTGDVR